jgi:energy-converting hydrogenase Eha subunit A
MTDIRKSYKTTAIGIVTLVAAGCNVVLALYNGDTPDFTALMAAVSGLGFLFSKDSDQ